MKRTTSYKLGFRNQKPGKKMEVCQRLIGGLGKLSLEKQELVRLPALTAKFSETGAALADIVRLRAETRAALTRCKKLLRELCRAAEQSAGSYASEVNFDPAQLLAGGVELTREQKPVGLPEAPRQLRAERGAFAGSVVLRWKRPVRRCLFFVEATTDPQAQSGWTRMKECTAAKCVLKELEAGKLYWFRVAALNAHGTGPWSQLVMLRPG